MKQLIYLLGVLVLLSSCSNQRYAHLNKVKSDSKKEVAIKTHNPKSIQISPRPIDLQTKNFTVKSEPVLVKQNAEVFVAAPAKPIEASPIINEKDITTKDEAKKTVTETNRKKPFDHYSRLNNGDWDVLSIIGFAAGLIGWLVPFTPALILFLAAIILSAIGLSKTNKGKRGKGFAIAGLILGVLGLLIFVLLIGILLAVA
jgi:hypothetical protein